MAEHRLPNKFGPWVVGDEFFNRTTEVKRLTQLLDDNNNILLVAPRRIGKTSLVRETFRRMEERGSDDLVFVDVQDCKTPEDVIVALAMATQRHASLGQRVVDAFSSFWKGFRDTVESVGTSELLELRFREGIADDWRAKAGKIVRNLADSDRPLAICLDELPVMLNRLIMGPGDPIENRLEAEVFLSWLRTTFTTFPEQIRWIICGSIGLEPILARHNLSFTVGHLRAFHLLPWDRSTAEQCLARLADTEGAVWPVASRAALLDKLGYFVPHHVQMYFGHVIDDCRMRGAPSPTPDDVHRVYETHMLSTRGHAELADYEERLLRVLDAKLIDVSLALLTEASVAGRLTQGAAAAIVKAHGHDDSGKALRDVLRVLEHDGYLEVCRKSRDWVFVSPLIRDWWQRRFGTGYQPMVAEE